VTGLGDGRLDLPPEQPSDDGAEERERAAFGFQVTV
jgi:hypothetical protein